MKLISSLATTQEVNAMYRALNACPDLLVIRDPQAGTIEAYLARNTSIVVFRAIQKNNSLAWIVRQAEGLLSVA